MKEQRKNKEQNKKKELDDNLEVNNEVSIEKVCEYKSDSVDLRNLGATDLTKNKRVVIPQLDDDSEEIRRNNVKIELIKVVENYKKKNCVKFGKFWIITSVNRK